MLIQVKHANMLSIIKAIMDFAMKGNPINILAVMMALMALIMRWRWDYFEELSHNPKKLFKFIAIWALIVLIVLRIFWQLKPNYFL